MKSGIKITIERGEFKCQFGRKRLGFFVVFCNFNPANYTGFLDSIGNVQRAGIYDNDLGFFIVKPQNNTLYGEFSDIIGNALLSIKK